MCKCNRTPNVISVITDALKNKFPSNDVVVEEVIYNSKSEFPTPLFKGEVPASFYFGNILYSKGAEGVELYLYHNFKQTFKATDTFEIKDVLFDNLVTMLEGLVNESINFTFYGWRIYLSDANQSTQTLTSFVASTELGDVCTDLSELAQNKTYYHNGTGVHPEIGDKIYLDIFGLEPFFSEESGANQGIYYLANEISIITDVNGVNTAFVCK